jgi:hypothetical protein
MDARRPEDPNTVVLDLPLQNNQGPHLKAEADNDQHQDFEEEIEAVIEDELTLLRQDNERLLLEQERMTRQRARMQRAKIVQQ